jgi:pimeloyl-ACP methyl ester carboxylesterase
VHLLGCGVGGFLSLLFIRVHPQRILSTILINSYSTNLAMVEQTLKYEYAPAFVLKKLIQTNLQEVGFLFPFFTYLNS